MIRTYFGEIGNIVTDKSRNKVEFPCLIFGTVN